MIIRNSWLSCGGCVAAKPALPCCSGCSAASPAAAVAGRAERPCSWRSGQSRAASSGAAAVAGTAQHLSSCCSGCSAAASSFVVAAVESQTKWDAIRPWPPEDAVGSPADAGCSSELRCCDADIAQNFRASPDGFGRAEAVLANDPSSEVLPYDESGNYISITT